MLITETQAVKQFSDESEFESTLSFSLEADVEDWVVVENDAQELSLSLSNWKKLVEMGNKVVSKKETLEEVPNKSALNIDDVVLRFKLRLNVDEWGMYKKGDEDYFDIKFHDEQNGLTRFPIDRRWDVIGCEIVNIA